MASSSAGAATGPVPAQAVDEHPVKQAIGDSGYGVPTLAEMLTEDQDGNNATDFLDLWVSKARSTGHEDAAIEVLAWWEGAPTQTDVQAFANATNAHHAEALDTIDAIFANVPSDRALDATSLEHLELIVWEPRIHATARDPAGDEPVDAMDHVQIVGSDHARDQGFTGQGTTIAILDTGIDCTHPSFNWTSKGDRIDGCGDKVVDFEVYTGESGPDSGFDNNGHGTHVASIAAGYEPGHYSGIAPDAKLVGLKVLDGSGSGSLASFESAVQYLEANSDSVDVASMSAGLGIGVPIPGLGGGVSVPLNGGELDLFGWDAVAAQVQQDANMPFTVSAGNVPIPLELLDVEYAPPVGVNGLNQVSSPGFAPEVITVGSVTSFGNHAEHSAVGPGPTGALEDQGGHSAEPIKPNVVTMGYDVWGAEANQEGYIQLTGTSMAAPAGAAAAALLVEKNPQVAPGEVKQALQEGARVTDVLAGAEATENPDPNFKTGHGAVQLQESLPLMEAPTVTFSSIDTGPVHSDSVNITWETNNHVNTVVEYGTGSDLTKTASKSGETTEHEIELSGLSPDTTYSFKVGCTSGTGCPTSSSIRSFTTKSLGDVSSQFVEVHAHDVFVESGDSTTFGDPPFDMDTREPVGEPDNEAGSVYALPGPVGPNSWEVQLDPGLASNVGLDTGKQAKAYFHVSPTTDAACLLADACAGALPLTVNATLYAGEERIGTGSQSKIITDLEATSQSVTTFEIPVDLSQDLVAASEELSVVYHWETAADVSPNELIWIHGGEPYPIRIDLPLENPVNVERIDVTQLDNGNHEVSAAVSSPFGSYDLDTSNEAQHIEIRDSNGELVDATLVDQSEDYTWVWDNTNDGITSGTFTVEVRAEDIQGASAARATTFELGSQPSDNLPPALLDLQATPDALENDGTATTVLTATVTDTDGSVESVTADLSVVGGAENQAMVDDGTGADSTAGDDVYTLETTIAPSTELGEVSLPVEATDDDGATATGAIDVEVLDGLGPKAPPNFTVRDPGDGTLLLNWTAAEDRPSQGVGVDHYRVERKQESQAQYTTIAPELEGTTLRDVDVSTDVTYDYRIVAVDARDNVGEPSLASGTPTIQPEVAITSPEPGQLVHGAFDVEGNASLPSVSGSSVAVPETLGTDPVDDVGTHPTPDEGVFDIESVAAADVGDDIQVRVELDSLGAPSQTADVFYDVVFNTTERSLGTSAHVQWIAGQPHADDSLRMTYADRQIVPSDTAISVGANTVTLELSKQALGLGTGEVLEGIQVRTFDGAQLPSTLVAGFEPVDEAGGSSDDPWSYTLKASPANHLASDPAGDHGQSLTSTDLRDVDVWDTGDDLRFRLTLDGMNFVDGTNGDVYYGVFFQDAKTGDSYKTFAEVTWVGAQPVRVEEDPRVFPTAPGTLAGSDNQIQYASNKLTFTISKSALGLSEGVESVSVATWLSAGGIALPQDTVPNGADAGGATDLAHAFQSTNDEQLFDDEAGDVQETTSPLRDPIFDLQRGSVHEAGDDLVLRLELDTFTFVDASNGEVIYHVGFDAGDQRFTADVRIFWLGSNPIVDPSFSLEGQGKDAGPRADVSIYDGTVTLRVPKTVNGLSPGETLTNVEEATYANSATLEEADAADGRDRTLLEQNPPPMDVETQLDDNPFEPVHVTSVSSGEIQWRQPIAGNEIATGAHTVTANASAEEHGTFDEESVDFQLNHEPDLSFSIHPRPTGVGQETLLDVRGTADDDGDLASVEIDPGDGTGPVDVTSELMLEHVYESPGVYDVTVTATDDDGAQTVETRSLAAYTVHNEDQGTWHPTIQEAVDEATAGDAILVQPGTYEEAVTVDVVGLTLCAANDATTACADETRTDTRVVGNPSDDAPVFTVQARDVQVRGFVIQQDAVPATQTSGIHVQSPSVHVVDNHVLGNYTTEDGDLRTIGINVVGAAGTVEDNLVAGWTAQGVGVWKQQAEIVDNRLQDNRVGVHLSGVADDTEVTSNVFQAHVWAVRLAGQADRSPDNGGQATGVGIHENAFFQIQQAPLRLGENNVDNAVDARLNDWGVYEPELIEQRISDEGEDNEVLLVPFQLSDGTPEPGLVRIQGQAPTYLSVQAALDAAEPGDTVLVPASSQTNTPTPWRETVSLSTPQVELCGTVGAGPACTSEIEPGHQQLSRANWTDAPGTGSGEAVRFVNTEHNWRSTSYFPPEDAKIEQIDRLAFDYFLAEGTCSQADLGADLAIDETPDDGEHDRDQLVRVDADLSDCEPQDWFHVDLFEDGTWSFAGASGSYQDVVAKVNDQFPDGEYEISAVNVVQTDDATVGYVDNQLVDQVVLAERQDVACGGGGVQELDPACRQQTARERTILNATGLQGSPAALAADDTTTRDLSLVEGDGDAAVVVQGDTAGTRVADNLIRHGAGSGTGNGVHVAKIAQDVSIEDNRITGWERGVFVQSTENVTIASNTFDATTRAVQHYGKGTALVQDNRFVENGIGLFVQSSGKPLDMTVHGNEFTLATPVALSTASGSQDRFVDARFNDWSVLREEVIRNTRIVDQGSENTILVRPYVDGEGNQYPPRPLVRCEITDDTFQDAGRVRTLQRAVDVDPQELLDERCLEDGAREIVLEASLEEYGGAVVDTEIHLRSQDPGTVDSVTGTAADQGARIQAQVNDPGLHFVDGSHNSTVEAVGIQGEPSGATSVLVDGVPGDANLTLTNVAVGARQATSSESLVVRDTRGVTVSSSTLLSGQGVVELTRTADTRIEHSRILLRGPQAGASTGIQVTDAERTALVDNTVVGILGPSSTAIDVSSTVQPTLRGNILADVAVGLRVARSDATEIHSNRFYAPLIGQFGSEGTGIHLVDGAGHNLTRNTLQNAGTGLAIEGATGVTADLNRFNATQTGVRITQLESPSEDVELHNSSIGATLNPLVLASSTQNVNVDAECNDWGVYHRDAVRARITDNGEDNEVDAQPFTSPNKNSGEVECLVPPKAEFSFEDPTPNTPITRLDTVQFTDESRAGTYEIVEHNWDFGDGSTGTGENPTHSYDAVGEFFVELTVHDRVNMTSSKVHKVVVENLKPSFETVIEDRKLHHTGTVDFDVEATDPEGDALTMDARLVDDPDRTLDSLGVNFTDHGDGTASFQWEPEPDQFGNYLVQLNVSDEWNTTSQLVEISVTNAAPVFEPALEGKVLGGAIGRQLTFDLRALDPDPQDDVTDLAADVPAAIGDDNVTIEGNQATLNWTPETGDAGEYTIDFTATSPGRSTTQSIALDIRADNPPPTIELTPADPTAVDETTAKIQAEVTSGFDPAEDPNDVIEWRVTTSPSLDPADQHLSEDNTTATWSWKVPQNWTEPVQVTFHADDGLGEASATTELTIRTDPFVMTRMPREIETDRFTLKPVEGADLELSFFAVDPDGNLTANDLAVYPNGFGGEAVDVTSLDDEGLWAATVQDVDAGLRTVGFEAVDVDGLETTRTLTFEVVENDPPQVSLNRTEISVEAEDALGARVNLSAEAADPEGRVLGDDAFTWTLPGGDTLTGRNVSALLPVGDHDVTLTVTDPFGEATTRTVDVIVDDTISSRSELDAPREEGYYRVRPTQESLEELHGWVNVTSDQNTGVGGAKVLGTVTYYGTSANDQAGVEVATFEGTTDANGVYAFSYEQEILGASPTGEGASLLSAPGWHEINVTVASDSRSAAPVDDQETSSETIRYFVAPAPVGPLN